MPSYDPQRSRHRPSPADDDEPAPVDALLEAHVAAPVLPEGVEPELTDAGGAVIHTASADVDLTARGDEEIYVDTTPRLSDGDDVIVVDGVGRSRGRSRLVAAVVAALLTILVILLWNRRRRPPAE
jgi:hypothetical protein